MRERKESPLFSESAEEGLVGALMMDSSGDLFEAVQPMTSSDFHDIRTRTIFDAVSSLMKAGAPHDARAVAEKVGDTDDRVEFIQDCADYAEQWRINARKAAALVRNFAKRRAIKAMALSLAEATEDADETLETLAEKASAAVSQIARGQVKRAPRRLAEVMLERTSHYEALERGEVVPGWPSTIPTLNAALSGGFRPGKLFFIGARPGVGKSSLSAQLLLELARDGHAGLFLSQEMANEEIADRAVANAGRIEFGRLMSGRLSGEDWARASEMLEAVSELPVWVDDQPALTLHDIRHKARGIPGLQVLVLDYLQLCSKSTGSSSSNRNSEIEEISRGLKALAMELDLCVIVLSQLNREVEKRPGKRPQLSDLRDSGSIEQDADGILFLWPLRDLEAGGKLIGLDIAKNRQSRSGIQIALDFRGSVQRWSESTEPVRLEAEQQQQTKRGFHD